MVASEPNVRRYFVDGIDPVAVRTGYNWLRSFAHEESLSSAAIFVHGIQDIHNLSAGLGVPLAHRLERDRTVYDAGLNVSVVLNRSPSYHDGPVLAVWVTDEDLLDRLDRWRIPALCPVSWGDAAADWKARWRPVDVRTGEALPEAPEVVANAVVVQGLRNVTMMANLSNGLDTYNHNLVAQGLDALHRDGEDFEPEAIRAWVARHGWGASNAEKIGELAEAILEGRHIRVGTMLRSDIVDHWRSQAKSDDDDEEDEAE